MSHGLVDFHEKTTSDVDGYRAHGDQSIGKTERGAYADFFSRPIRIGDLNLTEGNNTNGYLLPWYSYFTSLRIAEKLKGFTRLRANLHVKFVVNGSPFRYSDVLFSYRPLWCPTYGTNMEYPAFSGGDCACDDLLMDTGYFNSLSTKIPTRTAYDKQSLMSRSQRMNVRVLPQLGKGGEFLLPFTYPQDAINMVDTPGSNGATDQHLREMGTIIYQTLFPLQTTATASTVPMDISVYAWAEDVEIWGPSINTVQSVPLVVHHVQSGDEYNDAEKPSAIASGVARVAGMLTWVPIIGPFAKATEMAANAVSSVLRLFGWSNPPVISGMHGMLPTIGFTQPCPIISQQDCVLAMDPKNELTIDPTTVGCMSKDELIVTELCAKPSIFDIITWNPTDSSGFTLLTAPVAPIYAYTTWLANTNNPSVPCGNVTMTPSTYFAQLFNYWRGTMVLKLEVRCSQFHRGRLAVTWDPTTSLVTTPSPFSGAQISDVVDLASSPEIIFKIPYIGKTGFLNVDASPLGAKTSSLCTFQRWGNRSTSYGWSSPYGYFNGNVYVTVLNELQSGDIASPAYVVCSMWFEDMQFMGPAQQPTEGDGLSAISIRDASFTNVVQSIVEPSDDTVVCGESNTTDKLGLLYGGETIPSLRPFLHRSYVNDMLHCVANTGYVDALLYWVMPRLCTSRFELTSPMGAYSSFVPTSYGGVGSGFYDNQVGTTPIHYIVNCFTGYRGGVVHRAVTDEIFGGKGASLISISRSNKYYAGNPSFIGGYDIGANTLAAKRFALGAFDSVGGLSMSSAANNGCATAVVPMYSNRRMFPGSARKYFSQPNQVDDFRNSDYIMVNAILPNNANGPTNILHSLSCSHDFTVFGFVNVPDVYMTAIT